MSELKQKKFDTHIYPFLLLQSVKYRILASTYLDFRLDNAQVKISPKCIGVSSPCILLRDIKQSNYNFRRENQASLPAVKSTRYGLRSFRYEAALIWNSLPNDLRLTESFPQFKRLLHAWDGDICGCPSC